MTTTAPSQFHQTTTTGARHRQLRMMQLIFAGAGALAMLALLNAAAPDATQSVLASGSVHLIDQAFPQTTPNVIGGGGLAADDGSDQQAQLQQQLAQQEMQQSEQQAEEQNEQAQQQAQMAEQQGLQVEQQANQ
jgi:hypothetical protein